MRLIPTLAAATLAGALLTAPAHATAQVCEPLTSGKVDTTGDPATVTITAPPEHVITRYCVKAGSSNQGDGPVYVDVDPAATLMVGHPSGKAVSHWSAAWSPVAPEPDPEEPTDPEVPEEPETPKEPERPDVPEEPEAPIGLPRDLPMTPKPPPVTSITHSHACGRTVRVEVTIDHWWTGTKWQRVRTVDRQVTPNEACDPDSPGADEYVPVIEEGF